jgi:UDP-glucose 4-epimerase
LRGEGEQSNAEVVESDALCTLRSAREGIVVILITGGLGFIGLHTARAFIDAGEDVVLTQHRTRREPEFLRNDLGSHAFIEHLDVTDAARLEELGRKYRFDGICHLAGPGYNAPSPKADYEINVFGLLNMLEAADRWRVKRLTLASSVAVYYYGGVERGPFREDMRISMSASNPIEAFKKSEEILAWHFAERTNIDVAMMRIGLIYGPLHTYNNPAARMTRAAVDGVKPEFPVPTYAEDTTDLCHVSDCARAIVLLQMADKLNDRVYNIGGGRPTSSQEIAEAIERAVPGSDVASALTRGRGPQYQEDRYMDLARIRTDVGYEPQVSLDEGIAAYVEWLREHEQ